MALTRETLNLKSANKGFVVIDQVLQHLAVLMLRHHPKTIECKRCPLLFISTASRDRIRWLPGRPLKVAIAWRTWGDGFAGAGVVHVGTGFEMHRTLRDDFSGPLLPHQIVLRGGGKLTAIALFRTLLKPQRAGGMTITPRQQIIVDPKVTFKCHEWAGLFLALRASTAAANQQ